MEDAALEARREAERAGVRRRVHADVAVLGDERVPREPPGAEPGGEPGRLRRALEQRGPGPAGGAGAAAERRAVEAVDRSSAASTAVGATSAAASSAINPAR